MFKKERKIKQCTSYELKDSKKIIIIKKVDCKKNKL